MSFDLKAELQAMQQEFVQGIRRRMSNGEPLTAAEWNVIRQFLKDNNIEQMPTPGSGMAGLLADLPFAGGDMPSH